VGSTTLPHDFHHTECKVTLTYKVNRADFLYKKKRYMYIKSALLVDQDGRRSLHVAHPGASMGESS
jgi:hypothetical protein